VFDVCTVRPTAFGPPHIWRRNVTTYVSNPSNGQGNIECEELMAGSKADSWALARLLPAGLPAQLAALIRTRVVRPFPKGLDGIPQPWRTPPLPHAAPRTPADTTNIAVGETPPITNVTGTINVTIPNDGTPFNITLDAAGGSCPYIYCPTWVSTGQTVLCTILCDSSVTSVTPTLLIGDIPMQQLPVAVAWYNVTTPPTQCVTVQSPTLSNLTAPGARGSWSTASLCANTTNSTQIKTVVTPPNNDFNASCTNCEATYTLVTTVFVYDSNGIALDSSTANITKNCSSVLTCGATRVQGPTHALVWGCFQRATATVQCKPLPAGAACRACICRREARVSAWARTPCAPTELDSPFLPKLTPLPSSQLLPL
jgi:hypothetical protein